MADMVLEDTEVVLRLSPEHALAVREALDLFTRIGLGQFEEIATLLRTGAIRARGVGGEPQAATMHQAGFIEELLNEAKAMIGHPSNGSFGIGAKVHPHTALAYEVEKVLDQAIALNRNPNDKTCRSDGLIVRYSTLPAPRAAVEPA